MILQIDSRSNIYLFSFTLLLLSCSSSPENNQAAPAAENEWSGNITYQHIQTSYHSAPSSDYIYHIWNHKYDQQMEAKLINNKGTATSLITLLDTSYYRDITGGRTVEQWTIDKGAAQGKANTEITISIHPNTKTYSIEVPVPQTNGSKTRTNLCKGCRQQPDPPGTTTMGEDETSIMVDNEKPGPDANVLTGEKTERKTIDNGEGEEITITKWMFTKVKK